MNKEEYIDVYSKAVVKLLQFHFKLTIRNYYHSKAEFLDSVNLWYRKYNRNNKEFARYVKLFHLNLNDMVPRVSVDGKQIRISSFVEKELTKSRFHLVYMKSTKLKNDKVFMHPSFWMIKTEEVDSIFNDKNIDDLKSDYYNDFERNVIFKYLKNATKRHERLEKLLQKNIENNKKVDQKIEDEKNKKIMANAPTDLDRDDMKVWSNNRDAVLFYYNILNETTDWTKQKECAQKIFDKDKYSLRRIITDYGREYFEKYTKVI